MPTVKTKVKKWGNSFGVVIPKEVALKAKLHENDEVEVTIKKAFDIRDLFGKIKLGVPTQRIKDELREEWAG